MEGEGLHQLQKVLGFQKGQNPLLYQNQLKLY